MEANSGSEMNCTKTCFFKGTTRVKNSCTCKKLDGVGVASWLCRGVVAAFFASLEWCSCMYIDTSDGLDDDSNDRASLNPNAKKEDSAGTQILEHN